MLSLTLWLALLLAQLLFAAFAIAWAARACGSLRGRFWVGMRAVVVLIVVSIGTFIGYNSIQPSLAKESAAIQLTFGFLALFVSQFCELVILKEMFKLSWGRAFGPWGANFAVMILLSILALSVVEPLLSQPFRMASNSMNPTLNAGDRFIVNKIVPARRWDLVTYHSNQNGSPVVCKRLLGLPGEQIRFEGERLYINDHIEESPYALHGHYAGKYARMKLVQDGKTIQLGPDEFFLVGDDLDNSLDSRFEGPTHRSKLVGVAELLFWPLNRAGFLRK